MNAKWKRVLEANNIVMEDEGTDDAFELLCTSKGHMATTVVNVSRTVHREAGVEDWVKCEVTYHVTCNQNENVLDAATEMAFVKAKDMVNVGLMSIDDTIMPMG